LIAKFSHCGNGDYEQLKSKDFASPSSTKFQNLGPIQFSGTSQVLENGNLFQ